VRERVHGRAVVRVHLEVEVRLDPVGVAGVADEADRLSRGDPRAALQPRRERDAGRAPAAVVVRRAEIVVQVDVEVRGAAVAIEVEHAAGPRGGDVVLDPSGFRRDRQRLPRRDDVDPFVAALSARVAEVVPVAELAEDREDDPVALKRLLGRRRNALRQRSWVADCRRGSGGEAECGDEKQASGCRPVASHSWAQRSGAGSSKRKTLAGLSAASG
jgi:hypothetical protein